MAEFTFDFCPNSRVAEKLAPDEPQLDDFNGWIYNPVPVLPYRPQYRITLEGLRWMFNSNGSLNTDNNGYNAARLEAFYQEHRLYKPFNFQHEYEGLLEMTFASPVSVPKGLKDSDGLIEPLEITTILHNVRY